MITPHPAPTDLIAWDARTRDALRLALSASGEWFTLQDMQRVYDWAQAIRAEQTLPQPSMVPVDVHRRAFEYEVLRLVLGGAYALRVHEGEVQLCDRKECL